jgi:hypothetical protein
MTTTAGGRWAIWTDGGTGSPMAGTAGPASWVYRRADGSYLTVGPDNAEVPSAERPASPDGFPIPLQYYRLVIKLPEGPATDALVHDLEACAGRPDRDLLWRLAAAVGAHPDAPALLIAEGVRVECARGWVGSRTKARRVEVRVTFYL